jgi:hypothetical protein
MIKLFKIVIINILVFLGLLIIADMTIISIHQLANSPLFSHFRNRTEDYRWPLPNYKNIAWARKHFQEYHELQYQYVSYIGWRGLPYKGQTINIDEKGIRNTPQSEYATEKSPLVAFLGGSTMLGEGVNDANTIPAHFASIARGRYRTVNFGEGAYNAFQEYLFLKLQIINGLNPYAVVSYDGVNDSKVLMADRRPFSHDRENQIRAVMKGQDRDNDKTMSFGYYLLNPLKSFIAKYKKDEIVYDAFNISDQEAEKKAKVLLESWLCTKELAESHGTCFVAVLQPNAGVGKPYLKHLVFDQSMASGYNVYYSAVLKLLKTPRYRELNKYVIDLTDAFDREELIYIDDCHVSPNGNKIIAGKIYNHINKLKPDKRNR